MCNYILNKKNFENFHFVRIMYFSEIQNSNDKINWKFYKSKNFFVNLNFCLLGINKITILYLLLPSIHDLMK